MISYRSASLQYLWGMINTLQIIVHMPLLKIRFPANSYLLFSLISQIAQFDLLPFKDINSNLFDVEEVEYDDMFTALDIFTILIFLFFYHS